jgi:hypothetical protein
MLQTDRITTMVAVAVAVAVAAAGVALSLVFVVTPSLGVKSQLQIEKWCEQLAAVAAKNDGVFPADVAACRTALNLDQPGFADPWGRPYRYERESDKGPFRLWSAGADGADEHGAGDDIASWTR